MSEQEPTFKSILQDQSFYALLRLSQRKALTWDTFLQHPLPSNMSPLAVWDTLELIGRCTGIHLFEDDENNLLWYRRTHELGDLVDDIEQRVAYGSSFSDVLLYHTDRSFLLELRLSELAGTLELSGLSVDLAHLKIGARLEATSHHPVEKIAANALSIDQDLHAYAQEPFSHALFDRMYDQLVEGVGADEISTLSSSAGNQAIDEQKWSALRKQLDHVVTYANNKIDDEDLVVMQGNVIADTIRYYEIFGFASSLMGSLASRLFYIKHNLPALALMPVSAMKLKWTKGEFFGEMVCELAEYESTFRRTCCDLTLHHTLSAQCIKKALDEAEGHVMGSIKQDQAIKEQLSLDSRFNHRQRSIVARALRTPQAEFRIQFHKDKHGISYATARRDLVELVEFGYLHIEQRGRSFVFVGDKNIQELA